MSVPHTRQANSQLRQQLDAHNCDNRPPNVFKVIAQLWNCPSFDPVAPASECHLDFQLATDCSYDLVAGLVPATPQKIEDCFTSMRSDLLRIVTRWEQSGQGEGAGRDQEEDEEDAAVSAVDHNKDESLTEGDLMLPTRHRTTIGSLDRRPPCALQSRAAFLNGRPSYLLYFWEEADSHQLLQSSLQRLTNNTGAVDASSAPSVTSMKKGSTHSDGSHNQHGRWHHRQEEQ